MFEKVDENDFSRRRKRLVEDSRVVSKSSSRIPCRSNPAIRRFIVRPLVYIIKETRFQDVTSLSLLTQYQLLMIVYVYVLQLKKIHTWSFVCVPRRELFPIFCFYKTLPNWIEEETDVQRFLRSNRRIIRLTIWLSNSCFLSTFLTL